MGAWGPLAFDNDSANDWAYELEEVVDLSLVESAFAQLERAGDRFLDGDAGASALAACEVLARLQGRAGYENAYTQKVDAWVAAHPIAPTRELLRRAEAAIDRVLGEESELRQLWAQSEDPRAWLEGVEDLRRRVCGSPRPG